MNSSGFRPEAKRWLADFVLALGLFWIVALSCAAPHNHAHAVSLPRHAVADQGPASTSQVRMVDQSGAELRVSREISGAHTRILVLLSLSVAALTALNLAFWRHLRRVYASPRRGVWRRGN